MTEIPEHLLKRSQERRKALGLEGEGGEEAAAETPRCRNARSRRSGSGRGRGSRRTRR